MSLFECEVCKEKDLRIASLEQLLFQERTEKNRLLDVIVKQVTPVRVEVPENNEIQENPIPKRMTWPARRRQLEEEDRLRAENLRAEAAARKQMQDLIDESQIPVIKETEEKVG